MFITVYKCSGCGKMHYDASNMRKHVATVCDDAVLHKYPGVVVIDGAPSPSIRIKPGPKPVELPHVLRGRLPAFSDHGDDERIDYIFSSGLATTLLRTPCIDIPAFLFDHAWSSNAPVHMQSLVMYRNIVHEIESLDEDTGDVTVIPRGTLTKTLMKEIAVYMLELAYAIAKDSVAVRTPTLQTDAQTLLLKLREEIGGLSLRNALQYSTRDPRAEQTLAKLRHVMTHAFPSCFPS